MRGYDSARLGMMTLNSKPARWIARLAAVCLLLQVAIPRGYMPADLASGWYLKLCHQGLSSDVLAVLTGEGAESPQAHHLGHHDHAHHGPAHHSRAHHNHQSARQQTPLGEGLRGDAQHGLGQHSDHELGDAYSLDQVCGLCGFQLDELLGYASASQHSPHLVSHLAASPAPRIRGTRSRPYQPRAPPVV